MPLSENSRIVVAKSGPTRWIVRGEHDPLLEEVGRHDWERWASEPAARRILAVRDKRACYAYRSPGTGLDYFVKIYRFAKITTRLRHLLRPSQGEKEWLQGIEATRRGMRMPPYLAFGKRRGWLRASEAYCISEYRPGLRHPTDGLGDEALLAASGGRRGFLRRFARTFGEEVRRLHELALYHRELKPTNLYLEETPRGGLRLGFLDAKHVTVRSRASEKQRVTNLLRTFRMWEPAMRRHAIPRVCTLWFLEGYLGDEGGERARSTWRDLARSLRAAGDSIRGPKDGCNG